MAKSRIKRGEVVALRPPASLRGQVHAAAPSKRGRLIGEAFAAWLRREVPGDYRTAELQDQFLHFAESENLIDIDADGRAWIVDQEWMPKSPPPRWVTIARTLSSVSGVERKTVRRGPVCVYITTIVAMQIGTKRAA